MSPRDPFDDHDDEDSSTLDSFELIDEGLGLDGDLDDVPSRIPDAVEGADDDIPLLDDVVESPDELYGDYGDRLLGEGRDLAADELPAVDLEEAPEPRGGAPAGTPQLPPEVSAQELAAMRSEVRRKLSAEMDGIVAGVADAAVRRVVQDLEATIRGQLHESLTRRVAELIDEEIRNRFPGADGTG